MASNHHAAGFLFHSAKALAEIELLPERLLPGQDMAAFQNTKSRDTLSFGGCPRLVVMPEELTTAQY